MKVTAKKINDANFEVCATFDKQDIEKRVDALAVEAGKTLKVAGFRKGKVPANVVKKMHGEKLTQDAEGEVIREVMEQAYKELEIAADRLIGTPMFKKYERGDAEIDAEIQVCMRPAFDIGDYKKIVPSYDKPAASDEEIEARIAELVKQSAPLESITDKRALKEGDTAVFDFEGFLEGEPFEGGKADDFELEIGTGQFIPGFEEQMVGMKSGESKRITVTFPENYQAENLKGKETEFAIVLKDIKVKGDATLDDALAQKISGQEDATVETLKERVTEQITREKLSKLYNEELKPKMVKTLVEHYSFDLPDNIVEQEIDNQVNQKAQGMSPDEIKAIQEDTDKLKALREEMREDAISSVKATFIVDALAKAENVTVDDQEVKQVLYYEAMMAGQKPEEVIEHYEQNNLMPAVKMGMIEDKLFGLLLDLDNA